MARNLTESVLNLKLSIDNLTTRMRRVGTTGANAKLSRIERSPDFHKRAGMILAQDRIAKDYDLIKRSDKLLKAELWMRANPSNHFKSAGDKVRFDEIMAERRKRDRMRGIRADKSFSEQMLAITDPDLAYRKSLEEKFQGASQGADVAADEIIRAERSEKAKKIHSERRKRDRMNGIAADQAFRFDLMDDYNQEVETLTKRYGGGDKGRKRAEEKIRNEAFKKLPGFFKMFGLSNKALFDISKNTKGMPFLTGFLRASKNPITGAAMVLGAAEVGFKISDAANKGVVSDRNAMALFGKPSEKMQEAAGIAGLQDPGEISKRVGKMTLRFGNADMGYKMLGRQMQGMDATTKTFFASAMGLDETDVAIAERMGRGEGTKENSRARRVNAAKNKIEAIKKFGLSSDATLLDSEFWQALWYSIPGMEGSAARDAADFDYARKGLDADFNDMLAKMDETKKSAISADRYEAGDYAVATADTGSAAGGGNSTVTLILKTEDGKTVGKRVMKAGEKFTDRVAVADFFDKGE